MELIDQHTKTIMEGCKLRARDAGLRFEDESLEYIVTNRDLIELSPKVMIPTLYDYWVHDVDVLKEKGKYELYPGNPYETVINTRPAISFYNDNNPDWLNVMIFYHVIGHIDFFQNNLYFRHTWEYDFNGEALSDKRTIAKLRTERGRWVDYVIEFTRGIDNLVGYHNLLSRMFSVPDSGISDKLNYYFDVYLQDIAKINVSAYIKELERYNTSLKDDPVMGEQAFFSRIDQRHPEFGSLFKKHLASKKQKPRDLLEFIIEHSKMLRREENQWMLMVIQIIRKTALFLQPQIRTKIMNEGWASYWHETLFMNDDRIKGHEVDFARVNAGVTAMPRVGLNPYALGMRLFYFLEELAEKGRISWEYQHEADAGRRQAYNAKTGKGRDYIFKVRQNFSDFTFIHSFVDQDFVTANNLFVAGKRLNEKKMVWEYYVKSRNAGQYRDMLMGSLYHPPHIEVDLEKTEDNSLYLTHRFEGKPLLAEYIPNTMLGIEYLWGGPVQLETMEVAARPREPRTPAIPGFSAPKTDAVKPREIKWQRVLYTMKERKLSKKIL
ncbi:SpoVR family protein [Desulfosarcina alkanivorans]|uniref:SpoVR family protein n=1 Tax=Desulfosarcina alkanivorans TaxID=571177 RepID=A0A5K7Z132_9BACT|nr:SpoVR family protein [Desulfosarcina alkanivorans]BBO70517.1 SpoVR family protein [Desulfosarcina alkanivorans]